MADIEEVLKLFEDPIWAEVYAAICCDTGEAVCVDAALSFQDAVHALGQVLLPGPRDGVRLQVGVRAVLREHRVGLRDRGRAEGRAQNEYERANRAESEKHEWQLIVKNLLAAERKVNKLKKRCARIKREYQASLDAALLSDDDSA